MWGTPEGEKILIAGNEQVANFVSAIYNFDQIQIKELDTSSNGKRTVANTTDLKIDIKGGKLGGFYHLGLWPLQSLLRTLCFAIDGGKDLWHEFQRS